MHEIAIVGDVHIDDKVSSRKDDYFETCLQKITEVASQSKNIIFLGDLFNRPTISNAKVVDLFLFFNFLKNKNNNNFYSIIGNHDIFNYREDTLNKTTLGIFNACGLVKVILPEQPEVIGKYTFHTSFVDLSMCKSHLKGKKLTPNDVLLLHHYFEDGYEGFKYEELKDLGVNKIFFGHEHSPFKNLRKVYEEYTAYRGGSLLRNSADDYNFKRDIYYFTLDDEVIPHKLDCMKQSVDVFTESALSKQNLNKNKFIASLKEIVDKYSNNLGNQSKFSIKEALQEVGAPLDTLEYIEHKYTSIGVSFS